MDSAGGKLLVAKRAKRQAFGLDGFMTSLAEAVISV
jgi:hypothetical protein